MLFQNINERKHWKFYYIVHIFLAHCAMREWKKKEKERDTHSEKIHIYKSLKLNHVLKLTKKCRRFIIISPILPRRNFEM